MSLSVLGAYAIVFNLHGLGLIPLIALPLLAAETDILFQMARFHSVRAPDAALATGFLLALLLPPTVTLIQAAAVAGAAITMRHVLRYRERPVFNPAAVGVLLGALFFGMAPSWWGAIASWLVVLVGVIVTLRTPGSWRLPAGFLASYAAFGSLATVAFGRAASPQVLLLGALDPAMLFFGFFMVPEPRASPTQPLERLFFGVIVGTATAFLPLVTPVLAPLVALLLGNVMALVVRRLEATEAARIQAAKTRSSRRGRRTRRARPERKPMETRNEWTAAYRVGAGVLVLVVLGGISFAAHGSNTTPFSTVRPNVPASGSSGNVTASCTQDNPSVPSSTLTLLHERLGPSVILSMDSNSGTVVFYDPVNKVTVTETDMYEDFGYAEFNGDDYAVAGCSG